jgi:hypothetical protein
LVLFFKTEQKAPNTERQHPNALSLASQRPIFPAKNPIRDIFDTDF